jgi:hypothetical protein
MELEVVEVVVQTGAASLAINVVVMAAYTAVAVVVAAHIVQPNLLPAVLAVAVM